jgi:hypothetical protein
MLATATNSPRPTLAHASCSVSFTEVPRSFPSPQIEHYLTRDARSPSSESLCPSESVDRVSHCTIIKFLVLTASVSPSIAPRADQLNSTIVYRPDSSPPTSSSAPARGQSNSDHLRPPSDHRRDHQDLPDLRNPFTGARSQTVSPADLSSAVITIPVRLGVRVG